MTSALTPNQRAWRRFLSNKPALLSAVLLLAITLAVVLSPMILEHRPESTTEAQFQRPGPGHWLGTDVHGRDLLSRICYGTRISLLVGLVGAGISLVIGVAWGAVAGYA